VTQRSTLRGAPTVDVDEHAAAREAALAPVVDPVHVGGETVVVAVFGVRVPLVLPFKQAKDRKELPANLAARETLPLPVWTATLDLKLPAA